MARLTLRDRSGMTAAHTSVNVTTPAKDNTAATTSMADDLYTKYVLYLVVSEIHVFDEIIQFTDYFGNNIII